MTDLLVSGAVASSQCRRRAIGSSRTDSLSVAIRARKRNGFLVSEVDLVVCGLPEDFWGYRLLQLSDLHYGPPTPAFHIRRAVETASSLSPDIVILTGDYLQLRRTGVRYMLGTKVSARRFRWIDYRREVSHAAGELGRILAPLSPPDGMIGILGNHDYMDGVGSIKRKLATRVRWLVNRAALVRRGKSAILLAGIDDLKQGKPDLASALALDKAEVIGCNERFGQPPAPFFRILLSHNPDVTLSPERALLRETDLIIAGHTHGGQICAPVLGPIFTRTKQRDHIRGLSWLETTPVYVSSGIGYGNIRLRLFCPPEIVLYTLKPHAFS